MVSTSDTKSPSGLNNTSTSDPSAEEKTLVVYGEEKTIDLTVRFLNNAKKRVECCLDSTVVPAAVDTPRLREAMQHAKVRGVRLHYITEISKENISYCKQLAELVELRHLEKLKGKFAVNEFETILTAIVMRKARLAPKAIYSNIPQIVQQQQYFFETLWEKAIPSEQRIQEIQEGVESTRTRLIEDPNEIFVESKKTIREADRFSACITVDAMKLMRNYYDNEVQSAVERIRKNNNNNGSERSKGFRWITDFEKEDIDTVQHFLNLGVEVRHVRNIIPMTFAVTDKKLFATVQEVKEHGLLHTALVSNDPSYVSHYIVLFDELWNKGFDAVDRIRDIEEGSEPGRVDVIDNPRQIHKIFLDIIKSAKEEIIMMLPTGAFQREENTDLGIPSLKEATRTGVKVRVLMPTEGRDEEEIHDKIKELTDYGLNIKAVRFPQQRIRIKVVVVDRKSSLVVELKDDDSRAAFNAAAVGVAVYGTSRPTVLSYVTIFDSFWEQSELYERVREANEKLEQNDRLQREFINIAAHELRTPVQPILGMTELLELSLTSDGQEVKMTKEDLQIITRNAKRLQRLTSAILETARIEAGTFTLYKERFDLVEVIKNMTMDIQQTQNGGKIVVDNFFRDSSNDAGTNASIFVNADKARITEVLWNLLDNALKFTKEKGGGTISIVGEKIDNQAVIEIKDTGRGIDADMMPRLFSKFATKSHRGTGLGLFISKSIVEAHGGNIWAENNKNGNGGTFTFALPLAS